MRTAPTGDDGFTLVETIVSFSVFAVVSAAAALSLVTGIQANNDTADRVTASQLAQQATDRARSMPRARLVADPNTTTQQKVGGKTYSVKQIVSYPDSECLTPSATPAAGDTSVRRIAVHVEVRSPGDSTRVVAVDSVIAC